MTTGILETVQDRILSLPFHQACGLEIISAARGVSHTRFAVNDFTANVTGALHGGILYSMMDVAAFMALVTRLRPGQHPVTVDVHCAVCAAAYPGEMVELEAQVDRSGATMGFMRVEAFVLEEDGRRRVIGTGHVTKVIRTEAQLAGK